MKEITIQSFAKVNFSIDVGAPDERGYHAVDMVMQQLDFYDYVKLRFLSARELSAKRQEAFHREKGDFQISLRTNRPYLPTDSRNLAYKAAEIMIGRYGDGQESGRLEINIKKTIPVAAGMAGGSGNGAAVVHGLNILWGLKLSLSEICDICCELGSDVPFSAVGQALGNPRFPAYLRKDAMACACARATGTGTKLVPVKPLKSHIVIAKPRLSVSTAEVYRGIDACEISARPDNDRLVAQLDSGAFRNKNDLAESDREVLFQDFVNVLEYYTLHAYPEVAKLKETMENSKAQKVLMSGSGPTVFAVMGSGKEARQLSMKLRKKGYESYWTRTLV